jgi:hypothetical protein
LITAKSAFGKYYCSTMREYRSRGYGTNASISDDDSDKEERMIKFVDQKMRLCFIDIVSKKCKGTKIIMKDSVIFKSIDTVAKEHPFLGKLDLELAK